jgi:hypothetical protein
MTVHSDFDRSITAWLVAEAPDHAPQRLLDAARQRISATSQRPAWLPVTRLPHGLIRIGFAPIAILVLLIAVIGVGLVLPSYDQGHGVGPAATPSVSPSPTLVEESDIVGLPVAGAPPSAGGSSDLVLSHTGSSIFWVYTDGRMIWQVPDGGTAPFGEYAVANGTSIGLFEQHLSPAGIAFLRDSALASGLFERDLGLAQAVPGRMFETRVRRGDRLVRVTWAVRENYKVGAAAPTPTTEQVTALRTLDAVLSDPANWPASAWADHTIRAYVPARYMVCLRLFSEPTNAARAWTVLPAAARDFMRRADLSPPNDPTCVILTTDDARTLARTFERLGVRRAPEAMLTQVRYVVDDPLGTNGTYGLWVTFGSLLPDGEAVWLGPG